MRKMMQRLNVVKYATTQTQEEDLRKKGFLPVIGLEAEKIGEPDAEPDTDRAGEPDAEPEVEETEKKASEKKLSNKKTVKKESAVQKTTGEE